MIYGIGTDIVAVARIQTALDRHGERFARRVLAEGELAGFFQAASPAHYLAKRFAAKEATVKAIGWGFRDGLGLRQIAVAHDGRGRPGLVYSGRAAQLVEQLGIRASHLSLSDERDYALAFVTLLR